VSQPSLFDAGDLEPAPRLDLSPVELASRLGLDSLPTTEQADAVRAPMRPHVVVAGAGSGKTQTMGLRVVWLVANGRVEPHRVLGLTFTRKAAAELGERVRRMLHRLQHAHEQAPFLPDDVAAALATGEPTVTTYHSYAAGLVGEHALRIGLEPDTRLVGEAVGWQYAARVVESYEDDAGDLVAVDRAVSTVIADVLDLSGELAEHLREPDHVRVLTERVRAHLLALPRAEGQRSKGLPKQVSELLSSLTSRAALLPLVERYTAYKRAHGAMDYGDQVAIAARIARDHPEVAEIERGRFGAVLLDEYQDTGEAQRVLLTSLFGGGHAVTAVGDPRQSIYGWRGASAGNLERFGDDFAGDGPTGSGSLTMSFRNGEGILGAANLVADGIPVGGALGAVDAPLRPGPGREGQGEVVVALLDSVADEADWVADRVRALGDATTSPTGAEVAWGEIAVLARKRSHFPRLEAALRERGVPCEVVGLGGLLTRPEVVDVVCVLRVLADPSAGSALLRLLTGPRWRIGPRDLDALGRRARHIAVSTGRLPSVVRSTDESTASGEAGDLGEPDYDAVDERSLVDALDDLGPATAYSAAGHARLVRLRDELRRLRRWTSSSLPDLVTTVVRATDLDVELASRPGVRSVDALLDVDRFVEVAEEFVASGEDPGLVAFLAYLEAAMDQERGLEVDVAEPDGQRVQLMTVHAAKGLEWDAVFVAGLTQDVFPVGGRPVADWSKQLATLPFPLRGDRDELPELDWQGGTDQDDARARIESFREACRARGALEERRLAYVAVTRARSLLACSGYWWDTTQKPRGPSGLLDEIQALCAKGEGTVDTWALAPAEGGANPMVAEPVAGDWPYDPLGPRRAAVETAAALVRAAAVDGPGAATNERGDDRVAAWDRELELLLAELDRTRRCDDGPVVELPGRLSVSQLVELRRDPVRLARSLRRPLPRQPAPQARRGTRFHLWLEQLWGQQRLIDVDELPGSADESAEPDDDLLSLQDAFRRSDWASRVPAEVEFPFDVVVDGLTLRGRCDAVFTDAADGDGGLVDVVDWKTGRPPTGDEAVAAAVQLAVYRLAWHHVTGTPLHRIRAAFHYVAHEQTVRPADLLDHEGIVALLRSVPAATAD
jgi:DNA helicase-2/ATP-dependent DNA helicase PcrA